MKEKRQFGGVYKRLLSSYPWISGGAKGLPGIALKFLAHLATMIFLGRLRIKSIKFYIYRHLLTGEG